MAIDYGDVRTGIAFCDKNEVLASPYKTIRESYAPKLAHMIADIAAAEKAQMIVIGLPRNMDGTYGYRCEECKKLGDLIKSEIDLPVDFEDERLTTVMAHSFLSSNDVSSKKRKDNIDAVSAVLILQSYIDKRNKNKH